MTVLERLKAAGYDPAVSLFPDSIGNAGSMECERIQIRTFFCRPRENEAAIGVTATAMTHFSDGSTRPYPDGWPRSLEASVTLYFAGDADFHYFGNVATDLVGSDAEFRYRLLSRCIQDCKYFLGCGSRFSKYLWGCCVENHIQAMRILWDSFSDDEKPEWTSLEEIETFSKKMLEEDGCIVTKMNQDDWNTIRETCRQVYEEEAAKNENFNMVYSSMQDYREHADTYRAMLGDYGWGFNYDESEK